MTRAAASGPAGGPHLAGASTTGSTVSESPLRERSDIYTRHSDHGVTVLPDHVYVIQPNSSVANRHFTKPVDVNALGALSPQPVRMLAECSGKMERSREPVPVEDPIVGQIPRVPYVVNVRVTRELYAGSCAQSGVHQSVAGIASAKRTAAFESAFRASEASSFGANLQGRQGQFRGQSRGQSGARKSRSRLYLAFSPR